MVWRPRQLEEFIKYHEWSFPLLLESYRKRVKEYYIEEYEKYPEQFPWMSPILVISLFSNYRIDHYYLRSSESDQFEMKTNIIDDNKTYEEFREFPDHIQENIKLGIVGISREDCLMQDKSWYGESEDPKPYYDESLQRRRGARLADDHYKKCAEKNQVENKVVRFHLFEIEPIIMQVCNDDFQYEFDEAIKAYNKGLYLASTVTTAICIETLLKIVILRDLGERSLPKPYYILNMAEILYKNDRIDERLQHRINSFNELRRSAAHSKTGKMNEWDAEQGIALVKIIAESLF